MGAIPDLNPGAELGVYAPAGTARTIQALPRHNDVMNTDVMLLKEHHQTKVVKINASHIKKLAV